MIKSFLRLTKLTLFLSLLLPLVLALCGRFAKDAPITNSFTAKAFLLAAVVMIVYTILTFLCARFEPTVTRLSAEQVRFLDEMPQRYVSFAIVATAALSLFLELAIIRWQATVWEFFAFYKNFSLLACFGGLGLGYALARKDQLLLVLTTPLLFFQIGLLIALRHGIPRWMIEPLLAMPFREQLNMGLSVASGTLNIVAIYFFLAVIMLATGLLFVPVGQLCGRLMDRLTQLRAYGLNLLGSLAGVVFMFLLSFLWTPPLIWFAICYASLVCFLSFQRVALLTGIMFGTAALVMLSWPVEVGWERIYSPYQLLERGGGSNGLMMIRAAGHYYQHVHDLSASAQTVLPALKKVADYYELPYRIHGQAVSAAIVGAGTGNDVAAALRSGLRRIDAIEIDPAILRLGKMYHPEKPYNDARVMAVVDDARSFLRTTTNKYDMVVYGLLDSHTLLSQASSVRLDSFVYTVEGLREARMRLNESGMLSLSFSLLSEEIGRKIYLMMTQAFDGHPPICVEAGYDGAKIFLQSKEGGLRLPPGLIRNAGFQDVTSVYANPTIQADVSTDDWPFFYMPRRIYPFSYIPMIALVVAISALLVFSFMGEKPRFNHSGFFFLGAGFMLVETKGITELGLVLGNTWQVIGLVITGILLMAFLANAVVSGFALRRPVIPFVFLLASLAMGLWISMGGGFSSTFTGRITAIVVLTCPLFFSGMVFSTLLASSRDVSSVMSLNLIGALVGGMLEYNSMYFGFQFLYVVAMILYIAAFLSSPRSWVSGIVTNQRSDGFWKSAERRISRA